MVRGCATATAGFSWRRRWTTRALTFVFLVTILPVPGRTSAYTPHGPIEIDGDTAFTPANGVVSGTGTQSNPYVISGWEIATSGRHAIEIRNTRSHFVVRDVFLRYSGSPWDSFAGVRLTNAWNGATERGDINGFDYGVFFDQTSNVALLNTSFHGNTRALVVDRSADVRLAGNVVTDHEYWSFLVFSSSNVTLDANRFERNGASIQIQLSRGVRVTSNNLTDTGIPLSLSGCEDVWITGNELWNPRDGIELWNVSRAEVVNNRIISLPGGNRGGLFVVDSEDVRVKGNEILGNRNVGIFSSKSRRLDVWDNRIEPESSQAIALAYGDTATVLRNRFAGNGTGLRLERFTNATISANVFVGNGIEMTAGDPYSYERNNVSFFRTNVVTADNTVNGKPVVQYRDCTDVTVDGMTVGQLLFANCTGVTVRNLHVANTDIGLQIAWVADVLVTQSNLTSNRVSGASVVTSSGRLEGNVFNFNRGSGLTTVQTSDLAVVGNEFGGNAHGLSDRGSRGLVVRANRVVSNLEEGIEIYDSTDFSIEQNLVMGNGRGGMGIQQGWAIALLNNTVSANGDFGIAMDSVANVLIVRNAVWDHRYGLVVSGDIMPFRFIPVNVTVYHNSFVNNTFQAFDLGWNRWDGGYPTGGNFWSNFTVADACSGPDQDICSNPDGIGDQPFVVDYASMDRYPLMGTPTGLNRPPNAVGSTSKESANVGELLTFDARNSTDDEGIVSYVWDFGDGFGASGPLVTHAYDSQGTYEVRLTVSDALGQFDFDSLTMFIGNRDPIATAVALVNAPKGSTVNLDGTDSVDPDGDPLSFRWTQTGGPPITLDGSTSATASFVAGRAGSYVFDLTVRDEMGGVAQDSITVTVWSRAPFAVVTADRRVAEVGAPLAFDGTASYDPDGVIVSYVFEFGDGSAPTAVAGLARHTYDQAGTYSVLLTVVDDDGNQTSGREMVVIVEPLSPEASALVWGALSLSVLGAVLLVGIRRRRVRARRRA